MCSLIVSHLCNYLNSNQKHFPITFIFGLHLSFPLPLSLSFQLLSFVLLLISIILVSVSLGLDQWSFLSIKRGTSQSRLDSATYKTQGFSRRCIQYVLSDEVIFKDLMNYFWVDMLFIIIHYYFVIITVILMGIVL